jgi:hypothetical protein
MTLLIQSLWQEFAHSMAGLLIGHLKAIDIQGATPDTQEIHCTSVLRWLVGLKICGLHILSFYNFFSSIDLIFFSF